MDRTDVSHVIALYDLEVASKVMGSNVQGKVGALASLQCMFIYKN